MTGTDGASNGARADGASTWTAAAGRSRRAASRGARRTAPDDAAPHAGAPRDPYDVARDICLRELSFRPRTRAELATTLRKRGVADEVAIAVLDRYDEVGLINDEAFARAWVTSRHHGRGLARRALASELRQRGVDSGVVDTALEDLEPETEAATARVLVERRLRGMASATPDVAFRRLVTMLARKGYPAGVAIGAVKDALAARDATSELAAVLDVDAGPDIDDLAVAQMDDEAAAEFNGLD
jgi:regulatory protein